MEGIREAPFMNEQTEEQDQVAHAGALEEQDAMEGIRETPFMNEPIEEQDSMEAIEETPFINKQIEEQDQVAQAGALEEQDPMEGIRGTPFINEQIEEQDQVAQAGTLEEQDTMEGIRETPFIDGQIEEQVAMEGFEETPLINKQMEEQYQVAQAEEGDTMMLEGEYSSVPNIAEELVRQTSSRAGVECPGSPELEMSDVYENEGQLEAVSVEIDTDEDENAISTHAYKIIRAGEEESNGIQDSKCEISLQLIDNSKKRNSLGTLQEGTMNRTLKYLQCSGGLQMVSVKVRRWISAFFVLKQERTTNPRLMYIQC